MIKDKTLFIVGGVALGTYFFTKNTNAGEDFANLIGGFGGSGNNNDSGANLPDTNVYIDNSPESNNNDTPLSKKTLNVIEQTANGYTRRTIDASVDDLTYFERGQGFSSFDKTDTIVTYRNSSGDIVGGTDYLRRISTTAEEANRLNSLASDPQETLNRQSGTSSKKTSKTTPSSSSSSSSSGNVLGFLPNSSQTSSSSKKTSKTTPSSSSSSSSSSSESFLKRITRQVSGGTF